jgi:hypothetical protein
MTKQDPPFYRIYLLTVWEERDRTNQIPLAWRFSLQDPNSGRKRGFANLTALVTALLEEIAHTQAADEAGGGIESEPISKKE